MQTLGGCTSEFSEIRVSHTVRNLEFQMPSAGTYLQNDFARLRHLVAGAVGLHSRLEFVVGCSSPHAPGVVHAASASDSFPREVEGRARDTGQIDTGQCRFGAASAQGSAQHRCTQRHTPPPLSEAILCTNRARGTRLYEAAVFRLAVSALATASLKAGSSESCRHVGASSRLLQSWCARHPRPPETPGRPALPGSRRPPWLAPPWCGHGSVCPCLRGVRVPRRT